MKKFLESFRIKPPSSIAFVGAGGKTTCMFALGRELGNSVLITTTTHIGIDQVPATFSHIVINSLEEVEKVTCRMTGECMVVTGPAVDDLRYGHPSDEMMAMLHRAAIEKGYSLLIEADGSRTLPLKAPGEHEPAIPEWIETVIVCLGTSALGEPLSVGIAHRLDKYESLSGLAIGDPVTVEAAARVLLSPMGGLKRIPENASRILLLNQADDPERQAMAGRLAQLCLKAFDRVLISSLQARPEPLIHARYEPIAGILLAAGGSSRLGQPKQLLRLDGISLIRRTVLTGLDAGLSPLLVVVGSDAEAVIGEINDLPIVLVRNQAWQDGQSTSINAGVGQLPARVGGVVFLLSDQPYLSSEVIRALVAEARSTEAPVIAPLIEDQRGNPVYFDRDTLTDLSHLSGEQGGRAIFTRFPPHYLPWGDERLLLDIDTVEDLQRIKHG